MELQHLADQLISRINGHLGRATVTRLRFVQTCAGRAGRPHAAPRAKPAGAPPSRARYAARDPLKDALAGWAPLVGRARREPKRADGESRRPDGHKLAY